MRVLRLSPADLDTADFALPQGEIRERLAADDSELVRHFLAPGNRLVHKWHHYLAVYDQFLARYRNRPFVFLEIGVSQGGSLDMWRSYFGPMATIVGVDVNPACADRVTPPNIVRIGSQADSEFLRAVVSEFGAPDVVLDDGSHIGRHQVESFRTLFPLLREGGLYMIEDMHTSYWLDWQGGYRRPGTAIEFVKQLIDDQHAWYHSHPQVTPARDWIPAIHVYDSLVVLEKTRRRRPGHLFGGPQAAPEGQSD